MGDGLLAGRVAFVTGAAQGIGLAVARRFAAEGAAVAIADVAQDQAEREASRLVNDGTPALAVRTDVTDEGALERAADEVIERFGRVDCVVANAGVLVLRHAVDTTEAEWRRVIDVNLTGAFLTCKVFAKRLVGQGPGGRIILT